MEEVQQIHGEDGLEEPGLNFDQDSSADGTPDKENEMMQEPGAANQIRGCEEGDLFTYEVCPLISHTFIGYLMTVSIWTIQKWMVG
jgi:hypothetical protein